jgi:hypothetical protein
MIQRAHKYVALVDDPRNLITGPAQEIGDEYLKPEGLAVDG